MSGLGLPEALERIVRRCLEKRPEDRFDSARDLAEALKLLVGAPAAGAREVEQPSPYPGLRSFTEAEAGLFYGREAEVRALWEKLRERRLLAVIGPSGAGKTSFVRAGVLPARPEGWRAVVASPGAAPERQLAQPLGLTAADVGVAMGARGAAASAEAADVVLLVDRLDRLLPGIEIAQGARRIALQSVVAGIGLSLAGMMAAALGHLTPVEGAILQEAIDVAVIVNALRVLRLKPRYT